MTQGEHDRFSSALSETIDEELTLLLKEIKSEAKKRDIVAKYIQKTLDAFKQGNTGSLSKLLTDKSKTQLFDLYPSAKDTFDKLLIDVRRHSDKSFAELLDKIRSYCNSSSISLRGNPPKLIINNLLEIILDEKNRTAKIGTVFVKDANWEKIRTVLDREVQRIWGREFNPQLFRDSLLTAHSELIRLKPNPVDWVRIEDVYQVLKTRIQKENPEWKKAGRLVAYYKDEFSSDLSRLWVVQTSKKLDYPHLEFSGIRDPRLAYKLILPDGQVTLYGHLRPLRKEE